MRFSLVAISAVPMLIGAETQPKPSQPLPSAPAVRPLTQILDPSAVLQHIRYMATSKDLRHASRIVIQDPEFSYGSAWWFNKHAGELGISYTEDEIRDFNLQSLRDKGYLGTANRKELQAALENPPVPSRLATFDVEKLDQLPGLYFSDGRDNPDYGTIKGDSKLVNAAVAGGLYRLMKGVPKELWEGIEVMEVKQNISNAKVMDVYLGFQGTAIMQVCLYQDDPKSSWGISYVYFKVHLNKLNKVAELIRSKGVN